MRRRRNQIELRAFRASRLEGDILRAHRHVQTILRGEIEALTVDANAAGCAADVDDAELAALEERFAGRRCRFGLGRKRDRLALRERAADHEALIVRVVERERVGREQPFEQVAIAKLLIARTHHHVRMRGVIRLLEHVSLSQNRS